MDAHNLDIQSQPSPATSEMAAKTVADKELSSVSDKGKSTPPEKNAKTWLYVGSFVEQRSELLVHGLGYSLLLFAFGDFLHIVIPPRLTDPVWELQTIGALTEHAAIPLLGLILVFCRREGYIRLRERRLLGILSRVCLLMGVLYLLMLPLGINDTWRVYHRNKAEIASQVAQQRQQFQQIQTQLDRAKTNEQLQQLVSSLSNGSSTVPIGNAQEFKHQFLSQMTQAEQSVRMQAQAAQKSQKIALLKNSLKWNLGALISGTLLLVVWRLTNWARQF